MPTIPRKAVPSNEEIEYLLHTVDPTIPAREACAARHQIRVRRHPSSSLFAFGETLRRSRAVMCLHDHSDDGAARLISVIGGKLTTAASLRASVRAQDWPRGRGTESSRGWSGNFARSDDGSGSDRDRSGRLGQRGIRARHRGVARQARHGHRPHGAGQLRNCARPSARTRRTSSPKWSKPTAKNVAVTMADVLLRRVPVALGPCWSESCSRDAALRIGAVLGWDDQTLGFESRIVRDGAHLFPAPPIAPYQRARSRRRLVPTIRQLLKIGHGLRSSGNQLGT